MSLHKDNGSRYLSINLSLLNDVSKIRTWTLQCDIYTDVRNINSQNCSYDIVIAMHLYAVGELKESHFSHSVI